MPQARSFPGRGHVYDVLIVGAGIAGSEAAQACAAAGLDTLLVTTSLDTVYNLAGDSVSLKPHPDTLMAELCTQQPANELRNWHLHRAAKYALEHTPGIHLLQSSVSSLFVDKGKVTGVTTWEGVPRLAQRTALCVGSFLHARLSVGTLTETAGRLSEMAYDDLYEHLLALGFGFKDVSLEAPSSGGSLAYKVRCKAFDGEWDRKSLKLPRLDRLYAAGLCAGGYLSYEEAAAEGQRLAGALVQASR